MRIPSKPEGFCSSKSVCIVSVSYTHLDVYKRQPFGIKMFTDGVLVVGMSNLETDMGSANPAKDAGLEIGDILCTLDGQQVYTNEDVSRIISASKGCLLYTSSKIQALFAKIRNISW